jgi:hypothetical protein
MKIELDVLEVNEIIYSLGIAILEGVGSNKERAQSVKDKLTDELVAYINKLDEDIKELRSRIEPKQKEKLDAIAVDAVQNIKDIEWAVDPVEDNLSYGFYPSTK